MHYPSRYLLYCQPHGSHKFLHLQDIVCAIRAIWPLALHCVICPYKQIGAKNRIHSNMKGIWPVFVWVTQARPKSDYITTLVWTRLRSLFPVRRSAQVKTIGGTIGCIVFLKVHGEYILCKQQNMQSGIWIGLCF